MRKRLALLGLSALFLVSQTGCTVMTFNGDGSTASSLEMSNVDGVEGRAIKEKGAGHRGFFFLFSLIPIHVPTVNDAVGPVDSAHGIEITTEWDIIDFGINTAQSLVGIPSILAVSSRAVTISAEVKE